MAVSKEHICFYCQQRDQQLAVHLKKIPEPILRFSRNHVKAALHRYSSDLSKEEDANKCRVSTGNAHSPSPSNFWELLICANMRYKVLATSQELLPSADAGLNITSETISFGVIPNNCPTKCYFILTSHLIFHCRVASAPQQLTGKDAEIRPGRLVQWSARLLPFISSAGSNLSVLISPPVWFIFVFARNM